MKLYFLDGLEFFLWDDTNNKYHFLSIITKKL